jgi:hypothetical protein
MEIKEKSKAQTEHARPLGQHLKTKSMNHVHRRWKRDTSQRNRKHILFKKIAENFPNLEKEMVI